MWVPCHLIFTANPAMIAKSSFGIDRQLLLTSVDFDFFSALSQQIMFRFFILFFLQICKGIIIVPGTIQRIKLKTPNFYLLYYSCLPLSTLAPQSILGVSPMLCSQSVASTPVFHVEPQNSLDSYTNSEWQCPNLVIRAHHTGGEELKTTPGLLYMLR